MPARVAILEASPVFRTLRLWPAPKTRPVCEHTSVTATARVSLGIFTPLARLRSLVPVGPGQALCFVKRAASCRVGQPYR
jgi:hypothetical protein